MVPPKKLGSHTNLNLVCFFMTQPFFSAPDNSKSVDQTERDVLAFWKANNTFQRSIDSRSADKEFVFLDGPPFATGSPHYGHILAGTTKDAVPRYWTMKGFRVNRKFGWDCHGVPVEFQVEKENKIGGKPGIEAMGVRKFNELCCNIVMRCADEWEEIVPRMGRFVDFKRDYKTMDPEFMESVWWVFKELWNKDLIYEGHKVVPYSPKLGSPLSNFEANLNYKDIDDPAVTVKFELLGYPESELGTFAVAQSPDSDKKTYVLAWTTTPWTLPANCGLGFGKNHQYILLEHESAYYWIAEDAATRYFPEDFKVLDRKLGKEFLNLAYKPLFDFFAEPKSELETSSPDSDTKRFICIHDHGDYVSTEAGTGIVHFAPFYGAEDDELCKEFGLKGINAVDENGYYDLTIDDLSLKNVQNHPGMKNLQGLYFRADNEVEGSKDNNANLWVMNDLKERGLLFKREQIRHSYPHCWRTDCALMYRGVTTWFVKVSAIKKRMIELNQQINWTPSHLKNGRFGKLLESAPDWAISRNRYWGTPLPIWRCEKCQQLEVMGSRADLEAKAKIKVNDLHKHFVDDITWDCPVCASKSGLNLSAKAQNWNAIPQMHRIEEVLDCWFESGSMPYASVHYPFSGKTFKTADFISENMDQTRGWFYTLHVLGTALLDRPVFKNVTCGGIILAEDGQKMSKSKKNYPDPNLIFEKYGADAMRFYLLQSPVATKGENLKFSEQEVQEVLKNLILPLKNAYQFLSLYANIDGWSPTKFSFIRHGEAEHNVNRIYSCKIENVHHLTPKGKTEATNVAQELSPFDQIYTSPLIRTQETAALLKTIQSFKGEIQTDKRLREVDFGVLDGQPYVPVKDRLNNTSTEKLVNIQTRMNEALSDFIKQHPSEHVAIISHGGVIRSLQTGYYGITQITDHLAFPSVATGQAVTFFPFPNSNNKLDQWILSELQTLIKSYTEAFDAYDTETVCRLLPPFVDKLNNWYLRQNRKRFWAPGLNDDKQARYATLHYVLFTLSKLLAPICPFFAEWLYQHTSNEPKRSVHVDFMPTPLESAINPALEKRVDITREIVGLAASIRSRSGIKLRQPLQKLQFALTTPCEIDLDIVVAEANVKQVEILQNLKGVAKQIIKVDARQVGKKFGAKVQTLIAAGKAGDFNLKGDGTVEIAGEILSPAEYETAFLTEEGSEADSTPHAVVILDTQLSASLLREGEAREIIRAIQDLRKSQGLEVSDRIKVTYETTSENLTTTLSQFKNQIAGEVLAETIEIGKGTEEVQIKGENLKLTLKKC